MDCGELMGILDALKRPAVRIPLVLALAVAGGAWLATRYRGAVDARAMATRRHLSCIEVVTRAAFEAAEAGHRPKTLAELVGTPERPGAIETLFLREYAALPEFASPGSPPPAPRPASPSIEVRGAELLWEGYCYRLWPSPNNDRDFAVFAWPEVPGDGRLTSAFISSDPAWLYYTYARRYAGANGGPEPVDLGEPFGGKIALLNQGDSRMSPEEFLDRLSRQNGRIWAKEMIPRPPAPSGSTPQPGRPPNASP